MPYVDAAARRLKCRTTKIKAEYPTTKPAKIPTLYKDSHDADSNPTMIDADR
jgi:hypothetical protein